MIWLLFGLTLLFVVVWQAPAFYTVQGLAGYLPLHMFAETFSITISVMVFGVAWNVYSTERPGNIVILSCALLAVGLIDFAHMLSFKGMPDFVTPSGPEKAINFWLAARLIAALALLVVALRPWNLSYSARSRYWLLAVSLAIAAGVIWLGLVYPQAWPRTFIAGQGLTPFKIGAEYAIIAILLIPAVLFHAQARSAQSHSATSLFAATAITILSELSFTLYSDVSDIFNLLGHVYKIVAYVFIYRAVFVSSVRQPFQRLDTELAENLRKTEALRTASLYTRSLIEASLDPLVTISAEGKITDVNKATETATGRSRSELIGTDFSDCFAEPDKAREGYRQAFLKGFVSDYPLVLRHRDGRFTNMLYNASVYRNEQGEVLGLLASARDITERKHAEEALFEAQQIFRTLVENSPDIITRYDRDCRRTYVNPTYLRVAQIPQQELLGSAPAQRSPLPAAGAAALQNLLRRVLDTGAAEALDAVWPMADNVDHWYNIYAFPEFDREGKVVSVMTVSRDITERKLNEHALHRMNRELSAISNCNKIMMRAEDEQALLGDICRVVCDDAGYRMAWVGYREYDEAKTIRPVAWAGVEDGYLAQANITWADTERGRGPSGIAIRTGKSACFQDFSTDPNAAPWRESAIQRGYRSSISMPLKDENANTFGIFTIYSSEPTAFTPDEIRLLEELAADLAFGIMVLRTRIKRRQAEASLRENEEKYRTLIQKIQAAVIVHGADTQILVSNSMAQEILGLTEDQLLGKMAIDPAWHFFREDGTEAPLAEYPVNKVLSSRKALRNYVLGVHRPNHENDVWALVNADPVFGKEDELTQIIVTFFDITGRKRAEEALRSSEQGLAEAQRIAHLGSWQLDLATNRVVWSEELYKMYGFDPALPPPLYTESMKLFAPESWERLSAAIAQATQIGVPYELELETLQKDGSRGWMLARGELMRDGSGAAVRVRGIEMDITGRKQAEEEVRKLNLELEQRVGARTADLESANKELESFSYSVSHDLRTPLRAIDGFSRILLDDYADKLDDEGKRLLNVVRDNTRRMAQLIDDILNFSRTGRVGIVYSEIDMAGLARLVAEELLQADIATGKLQLEIEPIPRMKADSAMMRRVFVNLISNAAKFSRKSEAPAIHVGAYRNGEETVYFVRDNGVGFDMQFAGKLFGVFQRLHSMDEFEGTGIGLAIVKRIITRLGGRVWAEGSVNEGATVYFALPT